MHAYRIHTHSTHTYHSPSAACAGDGTMERKTKVKEKKKENIAVATADATASAMGSWKDIDMLTREIPLASVVGFFPHPPSLFHVLFLLHFFAISLTPQHLHCMFEQLNANQK